MKEFNIALIQGVLRGIDAKNRISFQTTTNEWSEIFARLPIERDTRVLEFGSGISPKIQWALAKQRFAGELTVVDIESQALWAQRLMAALFRPRFTLKLCNNNLFAYSLQGVGILVGNHLIDDVIASEFSQLHCLNYGRIFSDPQKQIIFWQMVESDVLFINEFVDKLAIKLGEIGIGSLVILNHYTSLFDRNYRIESRDRVCHQALDLLVEGLGKQGLVNFPEVSINSEKRWVVFQKKDA